MSNRIRLMPEHVIGVRVTLRSTLAAAIITTILPAAALAHKGPPFPILMNVRTARHVVEVWADPDIGQATFYVIIHDPSGTNPATDNPAVSMWTRPTSGRVPRADYPGKQQSMRNRVQFEILPEFDQRDFWDVGFVIETPGEEKEELLTQVESTPPGTGPWDIAIYLFPFALIGGLWVLAVFKRRRIMRGN